MLDFEFAIHKPRMLKTIKWFMHHELTTGSFQTAKRSLDGIIRFVKYTNEFCPDIESFSEVNRYFLEKYFTYALNARSETNPGNRLSITSIKKIALAIKDLLLVGNVKQWDVPDNVKFVMPLYKDKIIENKNLKVNKAVEEQKFKEKLGDEQIIDRIIEIALNDLDKQENVIAASAVVIMSQLGLRISELLIIRSALIEEFNGQKQFSYVTAKLNHEPVRVYKPANELVVEAVRALEAYTKSFQSEWDGPSYLYLHKRVEKAKVDRVSHGNFNKSFIRPWIEKHHIKDSNNNSIDFTAHTFRHAFATYALKGGASIEVISRIMNHKSIRGTTHYSHVIENEVKQNFAKILHEGAIISGKKALQIKEKLKLQNPFKGKTIDQVDKVRRAMKIQILSHGLCLHHPMRNEPCTGDGVCLGCQNFLTTPEYLGVHKGRLEKIQRELSAAPPNGPYESKLKTMESYLIGVINDLVTQMKHSGQVDRSEYVDVVSVWGSGM